MLTRPNMSHHTSSVNKMKFIKKISSKDKVFNIDNILSGGPNDIQTIRDSSRFVFYVSKFFGYSLFRIPNINLKNHRICRNFKVKTTSTDFVILITVLMVYALLLYYNIILKFEVNLSASLILTVGGQLCLIIGLIVSIASILLSFGRRDIIFKIFVNLCYIDILLETFYETLVAQPCNKLNVRNVRKSSAKDNQWRRILEHKKHLRFSVFFSVVGLVCILVDSAATFGIITTEVKSNPLLYVSYALQNASFSIITAQAVLFLLVIKTRFAALNKLICCYLAIKDEEKHLEVEMLYDMESSLSENQLLYTTLDTIIQRNSFRYDKKIIAEFAQIHCKLNDIVEWINSCYTVQCLGVVAVCFGYVIITFFSLYYALYRPHYYNKTTELAIVYMIWFTFYIFCVISLIFASWAVTGEGNKTGVLLHKSINQIAVDPRSQDAHSYGIIDSLRTFSLQLQKRSPIVSCGLFAYDWTLLFAIISSSATYLIILIQFDSSSIAAKICDMNRTAGSNASAE